VASAALTLVLAIPALSQSSDRTGSITTIVPQSAPQGKLATRTEIVADRGEAAMVTVGSQRAMQTAIAMYQDIVTRGGWSPLEAVKLERGSKGDAVIALRHRLIAEGYLTLEALAIDKPHKFDRDLEQALRVFQANHGLASSGKTDRSTIQALNVPAEHRLHMLRENLPRVSEYMKDLGPRYILVNIPSAQLEAVNLGEVYSRHNVIAGKLDRPSPTVKSRISEINFNPYWNVPASIVEKDLIPKLIKDPLTMDDMHIRIFDGFNGPEIDPTLVDWMTVAPDRYFFRQEPGGTNAMASVKINFANPFNVYLHDTPTRELFGQNARYLSSGCIRVDKVHILVDWILNGQDGFDHDLIEEIAASEQRADVKVTNPPDVRLMYLTAWATEDGRIHFRPDVYGLDGTGFVWGQPEPRQGT
jgi:murein L,D-transpeptidase YcbB/YkuD